MSTEWNKKLALVLRDPPDKAFDLLQLASYREQLGASAPEASVESEARLDWARAASDRLPQAAIPASVQVLWPEMAELTHPFSSERTPLKTVDLEAMRQALSTLVTEASQRFADPKGRYLWMWRYLPELLAARLGDKGLAVSRLPVSAQQPDLTVWQRMAIDGALASALPTPGFLVLHLAPAKDFLVHAASVADLRTSAALVSWLMWQALLPVVQQLGPDAVLSPSLRGQPMLDAWLAEQGVTAHAGAEPNVPAQVATLPNECVVLVPFDRAEELGEACKQSLKQAWSAVALQLRDQLAKEGWAGADDEVWNGIWSRQIESAWELSWTAVQWGNDSTGAGSLLAKQDVSVLEKWAKQHQDVSGLEDPWAGIYYGLWHAAAQAAAFARRSVPASAVVVEPSGRCTLCGHREALHGKGAELKTFWKAAAERMGGRIRSGECLCSVCTVRRLVQTLPQGTQKRLELSSASERKPYALVLFKADQLANVLRGGRELRQGATLLETMHSAVAEQLGRVRAPLKEILESVPPLGPGRRAAMSEALADYALCSVPELVRQVDGELLYSSGEQVIALVAPNKALPLVKALRERIRQAYVELPAGEAKRMALHLGASVTASAVVALSRAEEPTGQVLSHCHKLLDALPEGDALVVTMRAANGGERRFATKWNATSQSIDALLAAMPQAGSYRKLIEELSRLEAALTNPDVDRQPSQEARMLLARTVLVRLGLGATLGAEGLESVARAICNVIDSASSALADGDSSRALDGFYIARDLAGGER